MFNTCNQHKDFTLITNLSVLKSGIELIQHTNLMSFVNVIAWCETAIGGFVDFELEEGTKLNQIFNEV